MGEVFRARDTSLDREVAIKVLPAAFAADPERLARFEREAKVLASLNHPNIAAIYGFHEQDGVRFLAMELVPGQDLSERLKKGRVRSTGRCNTKPLAIWQKGTVGYAGSETRADG